MSTRDVPPRRELEIRDTDRAAGAAVGKVVGLAVDGCCSHEAVHCGCAEVSTGPTYARIPGGGVDLQPPDDLDELEDVIGPLVLDCPASFTKQDGQVVVVLRSAYDGCHIAASGVVRVVAGEPHSANGYPHAVLPTPDQIDASAEPITVTLAQTTGPNAERPAHGLYLGTMRGATDQGQSTDSRPVVLYVHGVDIG